MLLSLCWHSHHKDMEGKTLGGEEDFQEQDFPYSLFNLLTDEYQFTLLTHKHLCVCLYTPVHLRNNTLKFFIFFAM